MTTPEPSSPSRSQPWRPGEPLPGSRGPLADTLYPRERPKREDRNPIGPSGSRPAVPFNQVLSEARRAAGGIRPVYEGFR
jgi:hypothetical protein